MRAEFLECCSRILSTGSSSYVNIRRFKSNRFYKKYTSNKVEIKKEVVLVAHCQNCEHYMIKFLWYINKRDSFDCYVESKFIKGKKADKVYQERIKDWDFWALPDPVLNTKFDKQSKKVPWVYGKTLDDGISQVPRYIDETDNAGHKMVCPVKIKNLHP